MNGLLENTETRAKCKTSYTQKRVEFSRKYVDYEEENVKGVVCSVIAIGSCSVAVEDLRGRTGRKMCNIQEKKQKNI